MKKKDVLKILKKKYGSSKISNFISHNSVFNKYKIPHLNKNTIIIPVFTYHLDISHMSIYYYSEKEKTLFYIDPNNNKFKDNLNCIIKNNTMWDIKNEKIIKCFSKYDCIDICLNKICELYNYYEK